MTAKEGRRKEERKGPLLKLPPFLSEEQAFVLFCSVTQKYTTTHSHQSGPTRPILHNLLRGKLPDSFRGRLDQEPSLPKVFSLGSFPRFLLELDLAAYRREKATTVA